MRSVLRWVLCFGFLAGPVLGTAEDEQEKSRRSEIKRRSQLSKGVCCKKVTQRAALELYLSAQIDFFSQKSLKPHFILTKDFYDCLLKSLRDKRVVPPSMEVLLQDQEKGSRWIGNFYEQLPASSSKSKGEKRGIMLDVLRSQARCHVRSCKTSTSKKPSVLSILCRNRDCLEIIHGCKGKIGLDSLRLLAVLAFYEKAPIPILQNAVDSDDLKKHLDIDVVCGRILKILYLDRREDRIIRKVKSRDHSALDAPIAESPHSK